MRLASLTGGALVALARCKRDASSSRRAGHPFFAMLLGYGVVARDLFRTQDGADLCVEPRLRSAKRLTALLHDASHERAPLVDVVLHDFANGFALVVVEVQAPRQGFEAAVLERMPISE